MASRSDGVTRLYEAPQAPEPERLPQPTKTKDKVLLDERGLLDLPFLALTVLLVLIGVVMVFSASYARAYYLTGNSTYYFARQAIFAVVGIGGMLFVSRLNYQLWRSASFIILAVSVVFLMLVPLIGSTANGAKRWIDLGFTTFQPSELAKILLILFFARFLMDHKDDINDAVTLIKYAVLAGIPLALILVEPNLSTTICTALVICLLIYVGGLSYKFIGTVLLILVPVAIIFLSIAVQPNQPFLKDYQQKRILAFLEPEKYASDEAYQQNNSEMAIGSGQLTGKGLNNNTTTSVKNGNYISEPQTDFIFAIIGEELGFVGCCIIIALLLLVVIQCILIGMRSRDLAGKIICSGVGGLIGFQSFINISVATNMLPNTGVPLPFISYGLTSLVSLYIGIGFVLNVGLQQKKYQ